MFIEPSTLMLPPVCVNVPVPPKSPTRKLDD
jgi:hypothetical protein